MMKEKISEQNFILDDNNLTQSEKDQKILNINASYKTLEDTLSKDALY